MKKYCEKQIKQFTIEKVIKKKGNKLHDKWKGYDDCWIDKKDGMNILCKMSQYFLKSYERSNRNIKVELNLCSYATKFDLKGATGFDTQRSNYPLKLTLQ